MSPVSTEAQQAREQAVGQIYGPQPLQKKALEFLRTNLEERPVATLAVAAVVGLLIGRLVKR
jgi:ElaB/YqjD/DUF883 family membrane-anchored ribosome-binding protein